MEPVYLVAVAQTDEHYLAKPIVTINPYAQYWTGNGNGDLYADLQIHLKANPSVKLVPGKFYDTSKLGPFVQDEIGRVQQGVWGSWVDANPNGKQMLGMLSRYRKTQEQWENIQRAAAKREVVHATVKRVVRAKKANAKGNRRILRVNLELTQFGNYMSCGDAPAYAFPNHLLHPQYLRVGDYISVLICKTTNPKDPVLVSERSAVAKLFREDKGFQPGASFGGTVVAILKDGGGAIVSNRCHFKAFLPKEELVGLVGGIQVRQFLPCLKVKQVNLEQLTMIVIRE